MLIDRKSRGCVVACLVTITLGLLGHPFGRPPGEMTAGVVRRLSSGITNLVIFAGLVVWRVRQRNSFTRRAEVVFSLVSLAGVGAVFAAGYLAAHLVR